MMQRTWFMRMGGAALVLPSLAVLALVAGCSEKTSKMLIPNQPPTVRLTQAPVSPAPGDSVYYAYRLNWTGYDPDGRVDYYLYAIDPPSVDRVDSTWVRTERNEEFLFFPATNPDRISTSLSTASDPHIFAIRAVDNLGAMSAVVSRGFYSYTIAPIVTIVDPPAGGLAIVSPSVRIVWRGEDPDGVFTQKPLKYKYRLFASGARPADFPYPVDEPDFLVFATLNPDSLRKGYAPESRVDGLSFPGWDSTNAESTEAQYANLVPESNYLFVVTGFDEAGAYDPVFSARNMLQLFVTFANNASPIITMFNDFFNYTYLVGGYLSEERFAFDLEVPCGQEITFNWFATSRGGASIRRYRWVMDLVNLDDETTRSNELTDWYHWSAWSLNNTSATVGPFHVNDETHRFYIEAEDNNNLVSLGSILFRVVCATLDRQLLIVNDTRFVADDRVGGGVRPPGGPWPTAAELDTFMLARGGFPWKSYPGYDTDNPTLSPPGLFSRYRFDSLGTRGLRDAIVPISTLGKYRHVVWYTDQLGAGYTANSFDRVKPITALREMSKPNRAVTLATYMRQGGKTWLSGGGIIRATLDPWHRVNPTNMWTNRDLELVPGRMLYDFAHFRTAVTTGSGKEVRRGARMTIPNTIPQQYRVDPPGRGWTGQPNYSRLPEVLQLRRELPNPDPLPPFRDQQSPSNFYQSSFGAEILADQLIGGGPNVIREDLNGSAPGGVESTLDTLYHYITPSNSGFQPIATYYHGLDNTPLVFMGFPLWFPKRAQAQQIVDFVLQDIWGIPADFVVGPQPARAVRSAATPGIRKPAAPGIGRGNASGGAATRTLNARRTPSPTSGRTPRIQK